MVNIFAVYLSQSIIQSDLFPEQVDADYKLQDMKKMFKELEAKGKGYKKKLEDLHVAISKHMEQ